MVALLNCATSTDIITVSVISTASDTTYIVGNAESSHTSIMTQTGGSECNDSDIVFSATVDSNTITSVSTPISFDPTTGKVSWSTTDVGDAEAYTIAVTGTVTTANGAFQGTETFILTILDGTTCLTSTDTVTVNLGTVVGDVSYVVGDTADSVTVPAMTANGLYCDSSNIVYSATL